MGSFALTNEEIAGMWRATAVVPHAWQECANQTGVVAGNVQEGEAGGLFVQCAELGPRRAYMKPRVIERGAGNERAAREKIAADLAHEVGVPVPPVVLARRQAPLGEETLTCVSLVMQPTQWSWHELRGLLGTPTPGSQIAKHVAPKLAQAAAPGLAFDTWLDQSDHEDHPHNMIFGYDPKDLASGSFYFLDFSFSMGHRGAGTWENDAYRNVRAAGFPQLMLAALEKPLLDSFVKKLEALPDETITGIVQRIPDDYLSADQRTLIETALIARKLLVRAALAQYL